MRVHQYDAVVEAARDAARLADVTIILRIQDLVDRRLVVVDGAVERQRTSTLAGIGVHVVSQRGAVGFASVDDVRPEAARDAVRRAVRMLNAAEQFGAARIDPALLVCEPSECGVSSAVGTSAATSHVPVAEPARTLIEAQEMLADVELGADRSVRTSHHAVDEEWRICRSDGTDVSFSTSRVSTRHDLSGRIDGRIVRASAAVSGTRPASTLTSEAIARLTRRVRRSAADARHAIAPPPTPGSYRLVLGSALAKGLAHEAIGHLCESDVDGSVLMRGGRLRLGERLARDTVSIVDGPIAGDFAQQPFSANGFRRGTVALIERGILTAGLGDLFSHGQAGIEMTAACRAGSFRERPTPRMTNIRIEIEGAAQLEVDPDVMTPEHVATALQRSGLLDVGQPTLYLAGYRGGQAHPRRGDFIFGADAAYDLTDGCSPHGPVSFSGLAERALASIVAGIGPLCTDAIGTCNKDGSAVSSSGGSHALLVLDPDPDLNVAAAT